ncbi:MAG: aminodeoxychorismate lyase [Gammaproteobacteria bacterium]|nr:aminodeoxychorismate lyase [Gammaproteobacteria bacterium]
MLVNGQAQNFLPIGDRAVQYGDGLFETMKIKARTPLFWDRHLTRLRASCERLQIPCDFQLLVAEVSQVLSSIESHDQGSHILKIIVTRGSGGRGYTPPPIVSATRIVQLHSFPDGYARNAIDGIQAQHCRHPVSRNSALAGMKHLNRLDQVMASMELTETASEGLMCDDAEHLIEGIKTNVFAVLDGKITTPALTEAGIAGIMRDVVLEHFSSHGRPVDVRPIHIGELSGASELFVCNSVLGVWPLVALATSGDNLSFPIGPVTREAQGLLSDTF